MKLWTVQPLSFYEELINQGEISSSKENIWKELMPSYNWLINQMEIKIGKRSSVNTYPIWAWFQCENINKRKPDLRKSGYLEKGTKGVRIEIEKNDNEVLLSDFDLWNALLNGTFISDNHHQDKQFNKLIEVHNISNNNISTYPAEVKNMLENSWQKIFDMSFDDNYWTYKYKEKRIQATFWNLKVSEIKKVDFFKAR